MSPVSSLTVNEDSSIQENGSSNLTSFLNRSSPNFLVIPDMFVSFLAEKGRVNCHYEDVKDESIAWLRDIYDFDAKKTETHVKADFTHLAASFAPEAAREECRVLSDWIAWTFELDDMLDEGPLGRNPKAAEEMRESLLNTMNMGESSAFKSPSVVAHQEIWKRIVKSSSEKLQQRYKKHIIDLLPQVKSQSTSSIPDLERYLEVRRSTFGINPSLVMIEYAQGLQVSDEVINDKSIQKLRDICTEVLILQNDVCSYLKEQAQDDDHNIIAVYGKMGIPPQEALDRVGQLLRDQLRRWYLVQAEVPVWGEAIDYQTHRYIQAMKCMMIGGLNWSFHSYRYFGGKKDEVRKTRKITASSK